MSALLGSIIAQGLKPIFHYKVGKKPDLRLLLSTGGMPSSHTAAVIALCTSLARTQGFCTPLFAVAFTFAIITIHDAMGIRMQAGKHAEVLNQWSQILNDIHKDGQFTLAHMKTMLGHSFSQVSGGAILGLVIGWVTTGIITG